MQEIRQIFRRILQLNDTPESIASGAVIGLVIAMIPPPFWFQSLAALGVAWLLGANRLAAASMTFVTNPLTSFIYVVNYVIGLVFLRWTIGWEAPHWKEVWGRLKEYGGVRDYITGLFGIGLDVFVPMTVGGFIVGAVLAVPVYMMTKRLILQRRQRKAQMENVP